MIVSLSALLLAACGPKTTPAPAVPSPDEAMVQAIQRLDLRDLGHPALRWDAVPPLRASAEEPHTALVLLVEFSDTRFDRFAGEADQGDKLAAFYQELLFDSDYARRDTLSHYYADQSDGRYHMDGVVLPPIQLDRPLADFGGAYRPEGGTWRNDRDPDGLVELVAAQAGASAAVDWQAMDRWDPEDFDGDGITDEADGYLDHLIVVYAGKGQHACQRIRKLDEVLNPNVGMEAIEQLSPEQRECGDRIWPHRDEVRLHDGEGPAVAGTRNAHGGAPLTDGLWVRNYNMQCEYTSASTFIHETGHSLGLPDVYAHTSNNSTGPWEVMSHTSDPSPQNLSSWSRLQLGWLEPTVVVPPAYGGEQERTLHLADLGTGDPAATRSVLVVLPPKQRSLDLVDLPEGAGSTALYSGQGNDLDRRATVSFTVPEGDTPTLELDAWWEIEAGWDFAYLELSADQGRSWTRLRPTDARHMPARHGHDGADSGPGLTGLSGDLDGDGKNESHPDCDPTAELASGEDRANQQANACEEATWVSLGFDLSPWQGQPVALRWRYFSDGAAVENGLLVDNMRLEGVLSEGFEDALDERWVLDDFTTSPGHHELLVPHFYLLEFRDPQAEGERGYDPGMKRGSLSFFWDPQRQGMGALQVKPRAGVMAWYYDGAYAWSQNDPAANGPGHGYLLSVDANPNEIPFPGAAQWLQGDPASINTHYALPEDAQPTLREALFRELCLIREPAYVPAELVEAGLADVCEPTVPAPVQQVQVGEERAMQSTQYVDLLPGPDREGWRPVGELHDFRVRDGQVRYRLNDRTLRGLHTLDDPFSPVETPDAVVVYDLVDGELVQAESRAYPVVTSFSDADPARWLNPELPFGGVALPQAGLSWEVQEPAADAPEGTRATVVLRWQ